LPARSHLKDGSDHQEAGTRGYTDGGCPRRRNAEQELWKHRGNDLYLDRDRKGELIGRDRIFAGSGLLG
jgi:hypothetical protein